MRDKICFLLTLMLFSSSFAFTSVTNGQKVAIMNGMTTVAELNLVNHLDGNSLSQADYCDVLDCYLMFNLTSSADYTFTDMTKMTGKIQSANGFMNFLGIEILIQKQKEYNQTLYALKYSILANGTREEYVENGSRIIPFNISVWESVNASNLALKAGKIYDLRFHFNRSDPQIIGDLIPSIFGLDLKQWAWWNTTWQRKKAIEINTTSNLADYQVALNITYDSDMQADFSDLRFVNAAESTSINYWIEKSVASSWAYIWIKANLSTANGTQAYVYYKNSSAVSTTSNPDNTFLFYEDGTNCSNATGIGKWESTTGANTNNFSSVAGKCYFQHKTFGVGVRAMVGGARLNVSNVAIDYTVQYPASTNNPAVGFWLRGQPTTESSNMYLIYPDYSTSVLGLWNIGQRKSAATTILSSWYDTFYHNLSAWNGNVSFRADGNTYSTNNKSMWINGSSFNLVVFRNDTTPYIPENNFTNGTLGFMAWGSAYGEAYIDDIRIRNWTKTEPVYHIGSEQSPPSVLNISLISPLNNTWTGSTSPSFIFSANSSTNTTFNCTLNINNTQSGSNASVNNATSTTIIANWTVSHTSGTQWNVTCSDSNVSNSSMNWTLKIDTTAPMTSASAVLSNGSAYAFATPVLTSHINITLTCSDSDSGCDTTSYCVDYSNACVPSLVYSSAIHITSPISYYNATYIRYASNDSVNNTESASYRYFILVDGYSGTTATYIYGEDPLMCDIPSYIPQTAAIILITCRPIDNSTGLPMTGQTINCQANDVSLSTIKQAASAMTERGGRIYTWPLTMSNIPQGDCNWINCTTSINGLLDGWGGIVCRERANISSLTSSDIPSAASVSYQVWQNANRTSNLSAFDISYSVWQNLNRTYNLSASEAAYYVWQNTNRTNNLSAIDVAYQVWQDINKTYNLSGAEAAYYVWINGNRTSNASNTADIAYMVWVNGNKTVNITNMTGFQSDIWTYASRTLTNYNESYMTNQTWSNPFRELSNYNEINIANITWSNVARTLTNYNESYIANQSWENPSRELTFISTSFPSAIDNAYEIWQNANRSTSNLTLAEIQSMNLSNMTLAEINALFPVEYLTALEQAQLLNASQPNVSVNFTFNETYNQTTLMSDINSSLNSTVIAATAYASGISTDVIFEIIFTILSIAMALIAFMYSRTMLWLISGAMFIGLGIWLIPMSLIVMACCFGIGFYLWVRIFVN